MQGENSPLEKRRGAEGAGVVLTFRRDLEDARSSDSLNVGFPVFQDNPQTATPSPPLVKGEFAAPLRYGGLPHRNRTQSNGLFPDRSQIQLPST